MRPLIPRTFALLITLGGGAIAHPVLQNSMWMLAEPGQVRLAVNVSLQEIILAQTMPAAEAGYDASQIHAAAEKHGGYVVQHLHLSIAGREVPGKVSAITPPLIFSSPEKTLFQFEVEYPLPDPAPAAIVLRHEMLNEFPYAPGQAWDVSYLVRVKHAGSDEVTSLLLRSGEPGEIPTGLPPAPARVAEPMKTGAWSMFVEYLRRLFRRGS